MTTTLLFDVDGVLVDTEEWHHLSTALAAGREVDCSGGGSTQCKLRRAGFDESEIARIYGLKKQHYEIFVRGAKPNPDLLQLLEKAARVYTLAACSNSNKTSCNHLLINTGIAPFMQTIVTGGDVKSLKPAPDIYSEALGRLRVTPSDAVVFEDSDEGEEAAYRAGIPLVIRCTTDTLIEEVQKWL
jgi:HAD superfamily hydrolase (TIGR01509 family)